MRLVVWILLFVVTQTTASHSLLPCPRQGEWYYRYETALKHSPNSAGHKRPFALMRTPFQVPPELGTDSRLQITLLRFQPHRRRLPRFMQWLDRLRARMQTPAHTFQVTVQQTNRRARRKLLVLSEKLDMIHRTQLSHADLGMQFSSYGVGRVWQVAARSVLPLLVQKEFGVKCAEEGQFYFYQIPLDMDVIARQVDTEAHVVLDIEQKRWFRVWPPRRLRHLRFVSRSFKVVAHGDEGGNLAANPEEQQARTPQTVGFIVPAAPSIVATAVAPNAVVVRSHPAIVSSVDSVPNNPVVRSVPAVIAIDPAVVRSDPAIVPSVDNVPSNPVVPSAPSAVVQHRSHPLVVPFIKRTEDEAKDFAPEPENKELISSVSEREIMGMMMRTEASSADDISETQTDLNDMSSEQSENRDQERSEFEFSDVFGDSSSVDSPSSTSDGEVGAVAHRTTLENYCNGGLACPNVRGNEEPARSDEDSISTLTQSDNPVSEVDEDSTAPLSKAQFLIQAAGRRDIAMMRKLTSSPASASVFFEALLLAIETKNSVALVSLLELGRPVELANGDLLRAAIKAHHLESVQILVSNGASVRPNADDTNELLRIAADEGQDTICEWLIQQHGFRAAADDSIALILALNRNHSPTAMTLLTHGANGRIADDMPLEIAAKNGDLNLVKFLVKRMGADVDARDGAAIIAAGVHHHIDAMKFLMGKSVKRAKLRNSQALVLRFPWEQLFDSPAVIQEVYQKIQPLPVVSAATLEQCASECQSAETWRLMLLHPGVSESGGLLRTDMDFVRKIVSMLGLRGRLDMLQKCTVRRLVDLPAVCLDMAKWKKMKRRGLTSAVLDEVDTCGLKFMRLAGKTQVVAYLEKIYQETLLDKR